MVDSSDQREHARYTDRSQCMYSYLLDNPDCFYGGQFQDRSKNGAFFTSNYAVEPGTLVRLRKIKNRLEHTPSGDEEDSYMSVVWCKKIGDADSAGYGIGVQGIDAGSISI